MGESQDSSPLIDQPFDEVYEVVSALSVADVSLELLRELAYVDNPAVAIRRVLDEMQGVTQQASEMPEERDERPRPTRETLLGDLELPTVLLSVLVGQLDLRNVDDVLSYDESEVPSSLSETWERWKKDGKFAVLRKSLLEGGNFTLLDLPDWLQPPSSEKAP
jgi:hypothetical protein